MPRSRAAYATIAFRDVLQRYKQVAPLGTFFSPEAMGYFNSHMPNQAYRVPDGPVFFCTSEVENDRTFRRYTVRKMDWETGEIETIGPFCQYDRSEANAMARMQATYYLEH